VTTLSEHPGCWAGDSRGRAEIAATIQALADAAAELATIVAFGPLAGDLGQVLGESRDGGGRKALDLRADAIFLARLRQALVAAIVSEAVAEPLLLDGAAPIAVALDPLDGSNNIAINAPIVTIFSVLPFLRAETTTDAFLTAGERQLAAGYVLYGPHTRWCSRCGMASPSSRSTRCAGCFT